SFALQPIVVFVDTLLVPQHSHAERQISLHVYQRICPVKAFRRNAHNGRGVAIHFYLLADDCWIAVEALLPVVISQHNNWLGVVFLSFGAIDQTASRRLESQG